MFTSKPFSTGHVEAVGTVRDACGWIGSCVVIFRHMVVGVLAEAFIREDIVVEGRPLGAVILS